MKKALVSFFNRHGHLLASVACFAVAALVLMVPDLMAQIINTGDAETSIQKNVKPILKLVRRLLAFGAVVLGVFEAFKAAKGEGGKGWIKVATLFFVAILLLTPKTMLGLVGMDDTLCSTTTGIGGWGICE